MPFTYKFQINFTVLGKQIALGTEIDKEETDVKALSTKYFTGGTLGLNLSVTDLIEDLLNKIHPNGDGKPVIPEDLLPDLVLKDIYVSYKGAAKDEDKCFNLIAVASIESYELKFFFYKGGASGEYAFGLQADVGSLEGLPMVGEKLKEMELSNVGFVYASKAGKFKMPRLSNIVDDGFGEIRKIEKEGVEQEYQKGFHLVGDLYLPKTPKPQALILPISQIQQIGGNTTDTNTTPSSTPASNDTATTTDDATQPSSFNPSAKWFALNKTVGPMTVAALGFSYKEGILSLLFRGSVKLGGLTVSLDGLGLGLNPTALFKGEFKASKDLSFHLDGLGIQYVKKPVEIGGAFLRLNDPNTKISFAGAAMIKVKKFSITGIGAYALTNDNKSSLFLYALLEAPIGGPAFFFVTGIAAGFGYNRRVRTPDIKEVNNFPFVSMAISPPQQQKTLSDILDDLTKEPPWVPISMGDYWFAIGVKFTSFKIFESFILVIVEFGNRLAFTILGLSVLKWPDESFGDEVKPVIYVELALKITFGTGSDVIAVEAVITPNSYVFLPSVRLTGGFAFYTWISGEHEGDFVITLGGYHPKFKKPDHYPDVDRLGVYAKIPGVPVSFRGELYFALTPAAVMAGGRWEISYDIGFLKAYLIVWANALIQWAPFYYDISAGVRIGIQAKILFIRFKIEIGAELHIWGPPFAGEVFVDWKIFSFTIPFGKTKKEEPKPIEWSKFQDSFIPKVNEEIAPLEARIQAGVINTQRDEQDNIIATFVDPYNLAVAVDSFFPVKEIYSDQNKQNSLHQDTLVTLSDQDRPGVLGTVKKKAVGIKPMKLKNVDTKLAVWLEKEGVVFTNQEKIAHMGNAKGMPTALWSDNPGEEDRKVIPSVLAGVEVHTTEPVDGTIETIQTGTYAEKIANKSNGYYQNDNVIPQPDDMDGCIAQGLNSTKAKRETITTALTDLGFDLTANDELDYDDLDIDTPLFLAGIGEKIPTPIGS